MRSRLAILLLAGATAAHADTLQLQTEERHLAIGDVVAHVGTQNGMTASYAVDHGLVVDLPPDALRITDRRATLRLPDRTLICPLSPATLHEERGRLETRDGLASHVRERFRTRTWTLPCPDGPGVIWTTSDLTTVQTKGP